MDERNLSHLTNYKPVDQAGLLAMMQGGATLIIGRGEAPGNTYGAAQSDWYVLASRSASDGGTHVLMTARGRPKRFPSANSIVVFFGSLGLQGEITLPITLGTQIVQTRLAAPPMKRKRGNTPLNRP